MTKRIFWAVFLIALFIGGVFPFQSTAADDIEVSNIETTYVEKGEQTCTLSVRALVTNHGATDDVTIKAAAVDEDGFELETIKFTGHIEGGETLSLLEQVNMSREDYEQIAAWEQKE
ncbi:MAG: hypothetical protein K9K62_11155 [Desulfobacteraceae bacterium]|nr:hypothetical protein [Desulfobacteraceae bacterium]